MAFLADDFAAVVGFRNHAVFVDHIEHIAHLAALAERIVAVHSGKLGDLLGPCIADDKHLRKVELLAINTLDFCLDEADTGKTPAGA